MTSVTAMQALLLITDRSEKVGGRIGYTANTRDGVAFRCYLVAPTGLQKAMGVGQVPPPDAVGIAMASGKDGSGHAGPAAKGPGGGSAGGECSALLRAAGRCAIVSQEAKAP